MKKMLVFQTDFTYAEGAVPSMLGVVKNVDLDIECITATHQIPQYDTYSASFRLYQYIDFCLIISSPLFYFVQKIYMKHLHLYLFLFLQLY